MMHLGGLARVPLGGLLVRLDYQFETRTNVKIVTMRKTVIALSILLTGCRSGIVGRSHRRPRSLEFRLRFDVLVAGSILPARDACGEMAEKCRVG